MSLFVGTDIGGTFTDIVGFDSLTGSLSFGKKLTNREDLVEGVISCLYETGLDPQGIDILKHGTTQVINTLLERRGARTALVTTAGFRDLLEIGRAGRPVAFDLDYSRQPPLVERQHCFEVEERISATGEVVTPLARDSLERLVTALVTARAEAIAISFLNAYVNPTHEAKVAAYLRTRLPEAYITAGHELSREWYEYERTSTVAANAYVGPRAAGYVSTFSHRLEAARFPGRFYMMGSNGGVLPVERAKQQPIALIESGPIGGCVGAAMYSKALGLDRVIAFDMGGTTAKCALVEGGFFDVQSVYYVGGYDLGLALRTPVLDIVEVGTGGGSIASVDEGRLHVGPRSAGSDPGPACFRRGGSEPTVTDANVVLGRISGGRFLNGSLPLDVEASRAALAARVGEPLGYVGEASLDAVASGIVALANAQMATAIKEITIERGRDVREYVLFVFGGGGPLHGIDLARELAIPRVVVPPEPGNFSALGMLFADARVDDVQSFRLDVAQLSAPDLAARIREMKERVQATLVREFSATEVFFEHQAEMRFRGQKHSLRVSFASGADGDSLRDRFLDTYLRKYGHVDRSSPVEMIGVRVAGFASTQTPDLASVVPVSVGSRPEPREIRAVHFAAASRRLDTPVYSRDVLPVGFEATGPVIIEEFGATTVIGPKESVRVGSYGELDVRLFT
jgi:N-methylhydantoinase A